MSLSLTPQFQSQYPYTDTQHAQRQYHPDSQPSNNPTNLECLVSRHICVMTEISEAAEEVRLGKLQLSAAGTLYLSKKGYTFPGESFFYWSARSRWLSWLADQASGSKVSDRESTNGTDRGDSESTHLSYHLISIWPVAKDTSSNISTVTSTKRH